MLSTRAYPGSRSARGLNIGDSPVWGNERIRDSPATKRSPHSFTRLRHRWYGVSRPVTVPTAGEGARRAPLHLATASQPTPARPGAAQGEMGGVGRGLVNMNAESEAMMEGVGGLVDCGAGRVMEVVWPSGAAVRTEAPNHHEGRWLMTVVLSVVGKGAAVTASGVDREDER